MNLLNKLKQFFGSTEPEADGEQSTYNNDELYDSGIIRIIEQDDPDEPREIEEAR